MSLREWRDPAQRLPLDRPSRVSLAVLMTLAAALTVISALTMSFAFGFWPEPFAIFWTVLWGVPTMLGAITVLWFVIQLVRGEFWLP